MILAVVGSRTWDDNDMVYRVLTLLKNTPEFNLTAIVSGGATGADGFARWWAFTNCDIGYQEYRPDWKKHGKSAGAMRNQKIVDTSDAVLAFVVPSDDMIVSPGTAITIRMAKKAGKKVWIVTPDMSIKEVMEVVNE